MKNSINPLSLVMIMIFASCLATAQTSATRTDAQERAANSNQRQSAVAPAATASLRTSPFEPPEDTDHSFSTDEAPKLDTGCSYRSEGPITYNIEIKRFVGELNPDGTLKNVAALIAAKTVSPTIKLIMPGYDVDSDAQVEGSQPEIDKVYLNGEYVGTLKGVDGEWQLNSFEVDVSKVKFAEPGVDGVRCP